LGFRGSGFRVQGSGFRVQGLGFKVEDLALGCSKGFEPARGACGRASSWETGRRRSPGGVSGRRGMRRLETGGRRRETGSRRRPVPLPNGTETKELDHASCRFPTNRCRANMAHIRQSRPDSGLNFQVPRQEETPRAAAERHGDQRVRYRGTSLIRNRHPAGPYSRTRSRLLWRSWGGGRFLMSEVPL